MICFGANKYAGVFPFKGYKKQFEEKSLQFQGLGCLSRGFRRLTGQKIEAEWRKLSNQKQIMQFVPVCSFNVHVRIPWYYSATPHRETFVLITYVFMNPKSRAWKCDLKRERNGQ